MTNMGRAWVTVRSTLDRWSPGGTVTQDNGTELICRVPHVAPEAWFHTIYAPLPAATLRSLSTAAGPLPLELEQFFHFANGVHLFSGWLVLWGFVSLMSRDPNRRQPFSFVDHNKPTKAVRERHAKIVLVGSVLVSSSAKANIGILVGGEVVTVNPGTGDIDQTWESLSSCLVSETSRLAMEFDENGQRRQ